MGAGPSTRHSHAPSPGLRPELCPVTPKIYPQHLSSSNQEHGGFCNEVFLSNAMRFCTPVILGVLTPCGDPNAWGGRFPVARAGQKGCPHQSAPELLRLHGGIWDHAGGG